MVQQNIISSVFTSVYSIIIGVIDLTKSITSFVIDTVGAIVTAILDYTYGLIS